jgi:cyanophycinase-like exopeptidase
MSDLLLRAKTLLGALVTWLTVIGAVLTIAVDELTDYIDEPAVAAVIKVLGAAVVAIAVAINIVRRVTPVIPSDRGLLPLAYPEPARKDDVPRDRGFTVIEFAAALLCIAVIVWLVLTFTR